MPDARAVRVTVHRNQQGRPYFVSKHGIYWYGSPGIPRFVDGDRLRIEYSEDFTEALAYRDGAYMGAFDLEEPVDAED